MNSLVWIILGVLLATSIYIIYVGYKIIIAIKSIVQSIREIAQECKKKE